ncbi:MAG: hypothetical protein ACTHN7_12130 [Solirubrobacterales bacterium]
MKTTPFWRTPGALGSGTIIEDGEVCAPEGGSISGMAESGGAGIGLARRIRVGVQKDAAPFTSAPFSRTADRGEACAAGTAARDNAAIRKAENPSRIRLLTLRL